MRSFKIVKGCAVLWLTITVVPVHGGPIENLLVNPGAETGDLTGWTDTSGLFRAISGPAASGEFFFGFEGPYSATVLSSGMHQRADLGEGTLGTQDVRGQVSFAFDKGYSEDETGIWEYHIRVTAVFRTEQGSFVVGYGIDPIPDLYGDGAWRTWPLIPSFVTISPTAASVDVQVNGYWINDNVGQRSFPPGSIVDVPEFTRIDNLAVFLVPEPGSLIVMAVGIALAVPALRKRAPSLQRRN